MAELKIQTFEELWECTNSITADKMYKPRELMTREQALAMLLEARKHKKGTIPEEFLAEARKVLCLK